MIELKYITIGRLHAAIIRGKRAGEPQRRVETQDIEPQLIRRYSRTLNESRSLLNLTWGWGRAVERSTETQTAAIVADKEKCTIAAVVHVRNVNRTSSRSSELIPDER